MSSIKLSLEALEVLDAIARRGSFAAAAKELHRVPSAITYTIHKLETDLAVELFDRNSHRARPTATGAALMREASQILSSVAEVEQRIHRISQGMEAELRVAYEALIPTGRILQLVEKFFDQLPGVRVNLLCEALSGCWDALRGGRADLAIGMPEYSMPSGVDHVKPMGEVNWMFCVAPNHPLTQCPPPIPTSEIAKYRTILLKDSARDLPARSMGVRAGPDALTVCSIEAKVDAQARGTGVGFLPPQHARPMIAAKRLVELQVAEPRPPSRLCYAWQSKNPGAGLSWFLQQLESPKLRKNLLT